MGGAATPTASARDAVLVAIAKIVGLFNSRAPKSGAPKTQKKVKLDPARARREFLALKPAHNPKINWEKIENRVVLSIPIANTWKIRLLGVFFPIPEDRKREGRKVELDAIGSHVWTRCDGQNTISDLSRELQREYKIGAREAELSLQQFFKDLGRRGYVGFVQDAPKS